MNARSHELDAEISAKTRAIDDLDEASTELAFADEEESRGVLLFRRRRRGGGGEEGGGDVDARAGGIGEAQGGEKGAERGIGGAQDGALTRTKPNETKRKD